MEMTLKKDDFVECGKPKESEFTYKNKGMFDKTPTTYTYGDNYSQTFDDSNKRKFPYIYYYPRMGRLKQDTTNDKGEKYLPKILNLNGNERKKDEPYDFEFRLRPNSEYHAIGMGKIGRKC